MNNSCPLCSSVQVTLKDQITKPQLIALHQNSFAIDTTRELAGVETIGYYSCQSCDLAYFSPAPKASAQFYAQLQKLPWYYLEEKSEFELAKKYCQPGDAVLEVGCGPGAFAAKVTGADYTGLEFNPGAIAVAQAKGLNVRSQSIAEHTKEHPERYDLVCSFQVLEHIDDLRSFLTSLTACLKVGGTLILSVPGADSFLATAVNTPLNMPPHHLSRWSDSCLQRLAGLYQLDLLRLEHEDLDPIHQQWCSEIIAYSLIRKLFGEPYKLIDFSRKNKYMQRFAFKIAPFVQAFIAESKLSPRGHSAIAIYRK